MATEHTSPLVARKRLPAGHTVTVAVAPLFVLLLAASSRSPAAAAADSFPVLIEPTLVAGAQEKGAATTPQKLSQRKMTLYGSSKFMGPRTFDGILSDQQPLNPDFYNWNRAYVSYCDGASFSGDAEGEAENVSDVLPKDCLSKKDPTECFFPAELIKRISTPTFIVNSEYDSWQIQNVVAPVGSYPGGTWSNCRDNIQNCSSKQIDVLHGFRSKLIHDLKVAEGKRDWGLFIDSCFTHCQTQWNGTWHSPTSPRLGNKTIAEVVGDWYFGRREVKQIDCKYPCNPTCGS
ncbi:unnamed protein product [Urochloa decumbens]|uniref:Pectin acetylesterase n=1 Tax=Urochloa decumbens TaxID=240449 RepID=A0ABC8YQD3_9POAL